MSFIQHLLSGHHYYYFNARDQLQTKHLNIFQCFLRNVFGLYAETHLSNVVKKAYTVTLNDHSETTDPQKQQELLSLIAKAAKINGFARSFIQVPGSPLSNGNELNIGVRYNTHKKENGSYQLNSIDFRLLFTKNGGNLGSCDLSIYRKEGDGLGITFTPNPFLGEEQDTETRIEERLSRSYTQTISDFIEKILIDTHFAISPRLGGIEYEAEDYRLFGAYLRGTMGLPNNPASLNNAQKIGMEKLGWTYFYPITETRTDTTISRLATLYVFRKPTERMGAKLNTREFHQNFSINFADSLLKR